MTPYADRSTAERIAIMDLCDSVGSRFRDRTPDGFTVAIGRKALGRTIAAMDPLGFACVALYTFPLGTDRPAEHLRHDSRGIPGSSYLVACFTHRGD